MVSISGLNRTRKEKGMWEGQPTRADVLSKVTGKNWTARKEKLQKLRIWKTLTNDIWWIKIEEDELQYCNKCH